MVTFFRCIVSEKYTDVYFYFGICVYVVRTCVYVVRIWVDVAFMRT